MIFAVLLIILASAIPLILLLIPDDNKTRKYILNTIIILGVLLAEYPIILMAIDWDTPTIGMSGLMYIYIWGVEAVFFIIMFFIKGMCCTPLKDNKSGKLPDYQECSEIKRTEDSEIKSFSAKESKE